MLLGRRPFYADRDGKFCCYYCCQPSGCDTPDKKSDQSSQGVESYFDPRRVDGDIFIKQEEGAPSNGDADSPPN